MKLQEKISHAISKMTMDELPLLYEHILLLQYIKQLPQKQPASLPIEEILALTGTSKESWAESVCEERKDRI